MRSKEANLKFWLAWRLGVKRFLLQAYMNFELVVYTSLVKDIADPPSNINGVQGKFFKGVVHTDKNEILALIDVEAVLAEEQVKD